MTFIRNRLPDRREVIAVFGVIVFICHSWTILGFFNKLSSFMLYFTLGEIFGIFAYMMAFAFLESLAFIGFLVLLSAILPAKWLKDGFAFKGFVFTTITAAAFLLFQSFLESKYPSTLMLSLSIFVPLVLIAILIQVVNSSTVIRNILLNIQDRFLIMLFIYAPIGILSLLVVMYRILL